MGSACTAGKVLGMGEKWFFSACWPRLNGSEECPPMLSFGDFVFSLALKTLWLSQFSIISIISIIFYYSVPFSQILATTVQRNTKSESRIEHKVIRSAWNENLDVVCFFNTNLNIYIFPLNKPKSVFSRLFPAPAPAAHIKTDFQIFPAVSFTGRTSPKILHLPEIGTKSLEIARWRRGHIALGEF